MFKEKKKKLIGQRRLYVRKHNKMTNLNKEIEKLENIIGKYKIHIRKKQEQSLKNHIARFKLISKNLKKKIENYKKNEKYKTINKNICLKYAKINGSYIVKFMYENDRRNLNQGFKSDWIIEKQFDIEGEPTGEYKIHLK